MALHVVEPNNNGMMFMVDGPAKSQQNHQFWMVETLYPLVPSNMVGWKISEVNGGFNRKTADR